MKLLAAAGLLGFVSVAFGSYVEHALRAPLLDSDPEAYRALMTAIRYNQVHAVAALAVGLALWRAPEGRAARWLGLAGWGFVVGVSLFSGGIYLSVVLGVPELTYAAPVGGVTMMLSWLALALAALAARRAEA